ncbi:MAG: histidine kinase [Chloroflexota bacterium]|nr:histidine kinase [Chloroflexota bacterium]
MPRHWVGAKSSNVAFLGFFTLYALAATTWLLLGLAPALISLSDSAHDRLHQWAGAQREIEVVVKSWGGEFHQDELVMPANETVVLHFANEEQGVGHNVGIYDDDSSSNPIFRSDVLTGPGKAQYSFQAPASGTYYFRCDLDPSMEGLLTVLEGAHGGGSSRLEDSVRAAVMVSHDAEHRAQFTLQYTFSLINVGLGILLVRLRPSDRAARLLAVAMVGTGAVYNLQAHSADKVVSAIGPMHEVFHIVSGLAYVLALLAFPDGRLVPGWPRKGWYRWPARALYATAIFFTGGVLFGDGEPETYIAAFGVAIPIVGALSQSLRYRRSSSAEERQQSKLLMWALLLAFAAALFLGVIALIPTTVNHSLLAPTIEEIKRFVFLVFPPLFVVIPMTLFIVLVRYRLWDMDRVINRTLVFGALTAGVILLYVLLVGAANLMLFGTRGNWLISLLAAGIIAVLFHPLRTRLQRGVNRLMYGERDDPYAVLSSLGQRLEATLAPESVLSTIVETIAQALKLPYVAVALKQDDEFDIAAESGRRVNDEIFCLPLVYQGEAVGQLHLAPRGPRDGFTPSDHRLLEALARQAEVAVHAVRLTTDLQRARERLVTAREEERRRLRRDLHDGLGPQLASHTLTLDAVSRLMERDPKAAAALLQDLKVQSQSSITDIRRLVYDLRPPALDDLGLVPALQKLAEQYAYTELRTSIDAPESLPHLPAAVEVACYRIVQEALTNAVRHSGGRNCRIRLTVSDVLCIEITDDGSGLSADLRPGVGLRSMRERAEELGGTCVIEPSPTGGTRIRALIPLPKETL